MNDQILFFKIEIDRKMCSNRIFTKDNWLEFEIENNVCDAQRKKKKSTEESVPINHEIMTRKTTRKNLEMLESHSIRGRKRKNKERIF